MQIPAISIGVAGITRRSPACSGGLDGVGLGLRPGVAGSGGSFGAMLTSAISAT